MVKVTKHGVLLRPSKQEFEHGAVLNPTCVQHGNIIHMFYRAVRNGNNSTIGYCRLNGPTKVVYRSKKPILVPEYPYEKQGMEDPRVIKIGKKYYLFYTAYDGKNCLIAYATSTDLKKWKKHGTISPTITYNEAGDLLRKNWPHIKEKYFFFQEYTKNMVGKDVLLWEKDGMIFPKKINRQFALMHRILPEIQVAFFKDFKELDNNYWKRYLTNISKNIMLAPGHDYESRNIGGGAPPIETEKGWLVIYHAAQDTNSGKVYHCSAALFDKNDPTKLIGRLEKPLFSPTKSYEKKGYISNVVFPTGTAIFDDRLYIYYGAADKRIAVASVKLSKLLEELDQSKNVGYVADRIFEYVTDNKKDAEIICKKISCDERTFCMGIGWLLREGKIYVKFKEGKIFLRLNR